MKQDRFLSRALFVFAAFLLLLALALNSAEADIAAFVLVACAIGAWALGGRWGALGEASPARPLVAGTFGAGMLVTFIGGYCSIGSAGELGPTTPELESGILSLAMVLGLGVAVLGALIVANVTTRAFSRRPPAASDSDGPSRPA